MTFNTEIEIAIKLYVYANANNIMYYKFMLMQTISKGNKLKSIE